MSYCRFLERGSDCYIWGDEDGRLQCCYGDGRIFTADGAAQMLSALKRMGLRIPTSARRRLVREAKRAALKGA